MSLPSRGKIKSQRDPFPIPNALSGRIVLAGFPIYKERITRNIRHALGNHVAG